MVYIKKALLFVLWFAASAGTGWFGLGGMLERAKENGREEAAEEVTPNELPTQPDPANVHVHKFLRWHDCETRTVCYLINGGVDCLKDINTPWLEAECAKESE
tara:strand:+ start:516 stop:824 length:309 start_codon:yes stop_codon:yes gene_type:complete